MEPAAPCVIVHCLQLVLMEVNETTADSLLVAVTSPLPDAVVVPVSGRLNLTTTQVATWRGGVLSYDIRISKKDFGICTNRGMMIVWIYPTLFRHSKCFTINPLFIK